MRKFACVIFDTLTVCGIIPDALTYGSYTRALAATKYNNLNNLTNTLLFDQFLFLEEIGLIWFYQRSNVIEQAQSDFIIEKMNTHNNNINHSASKHNTNTMLASIFQRKKRIIVPVKIRKINCSGCSMDEMTGGD